MDAEGGKMLIRRGSIIIQAHNNRLLMCLIKIEMEVYQKRNLRN